jgi:hypothetical protein
MELDILPGGVHELPIYPGQNLSSPRFPPGAGLEIAVPGTITGIVHVIGLGPVVVRIHIDDDAEEETKEVMGGDILQEKETSDEALQRGAGMRRMKRAGIKVLRVLGRWEGWEIWGRIEEE